MRDWIHDVSVGLVGHILEQKYDMLESIFRAAPEEYAIEEQRIAILGAAKDAFFMSLEDAVRDWQPTRVPAPVLHAGPPADAAAGGPQYFHMPQQDYRAEEVVPRHPVPPPPPGAPPPAGLGPMGKPPPYTKQPPAILRQRLAELAPGPYGQSAAAASSSSAAAPAAPAAPAAQDPWREQMMPEQTAGPPAERPPTQGSLLAAGQHPGADDRQLRRQERGSKMSQPQQRPPRAD